MSQQINLEREKKARAANESCPQGRVGIKWIKCLIRQWCRESERERKKSGEAKNLFEPHLFALSSLLIKSNEERTVGWMEGCCGDMAQEERQAWRAGLGEAGEAIRKREWCESDALGVMRRQKARRDCRGGKLAEANYCLLGLCYGYIRVIWWQHIRRARRSATKSNREWWAQKMKYKCK